MMLSNNFFYVFLVGSVFVASVSQVFLKKAAMKEYDSFIKEYLNWRVILGYGLMVVSTILTIIAFTKIEYRNGPVIEALGYVFVMIFSRMFFGEKITAKKIIGNALILLGIFVYYM